MSRVPLILGVCFHVFSVLFLSSPTGVVKGSFTTRSCPPPCCRLLRLPRWRDPCPCPCQTPNLPPPPLREAATPPPRQVSTTAHHLPSHTHSTLDPVRKVSLVSQACESLSSVFFIMNRISHQTCALSVSILPLNSCTAPNAIFIFILCVCVYLIHHSLFHTEHVSRSALCQRGPQRPQLCKYPSAASGEYTCTDPSNP